VRVALRVRNSTACGQARSVAVTGVTPMSLPSTKTCEPLGIDSSTAVPILGVDCTFIQYARPPTPAVNTMAATATCGTHRTIDPPSDRASIAVLAATEGPRRSTLTRSFL